jgi:NADPH2:quinone reductase
MRPSFPHYVAERADLERYGKELFDLILSTSINVTIHDVYPLQEAAQAHIDIESRKTTGKLLIDCS